MGDELRPCKRCGASGKAMYQMYSDGTEDYWVVCNNRFCGEETATHETQEAAIGEWNEPSEEQLLRAEVERLKGIIRKVEWSVVVLGLTPRDTNRQCPICANAKCEDHDEDCPFYKWEGGEP